MSEHAPLGGKLLTKPFLFFAVLFMIALAFLATRFIFGLGSVTNLSDGYLGDLDCHRRNGRHGVRLRRLCGGVTGLCP